MPSEHHYKRSLFLHVNKSQRLILYPLLLASVVACGIAIYNMLFIGYLDQHLALFCNIDLTHMERAVPWFMQFDRFRDFIPFLLMMIAVLLLLVIYWTYFLSNKLVGPYERVIHEMDEILDGKKKGPIGTRKGDEIFEELLKRINALITKIR